MPLYEFEGKRPKIHESAFIHPEAVIIGDVTIGRNVFVAPGAVLRGDWGTIVVGDGSNIQDNVIIHARPGKTAWLDVDSHIGHGAILHTPKLGKHVTIGMGAIVMDEAEIGDEAVVASGCLVLAGTKIPPRKLIMGVPGKVVKDLTPEMLEYFRWGTKMYQTLPRRYASTLKRIDK